MVNETERTVRRAGAATAKELRDEEARLFLEEGVRVDFHPRARRVAGSAEGIALISHGEQRTIALRHLLESLDSIRQAVTQAFANESDPLTRVRAMIRAHVVSMLENREKHAMMLTELGSLSSPRRDEVVRLRGEYERLARGVL